MHSKIEIVGLAAPLLGESSVKENEWFNKCELSLRSFIQNKLGELCESQDIGFIAVDYCTLKKITRKFCEEPKSLTIEIFVWLFANGTRSHSVAPCKFVISQTESLLQSRNTVRFFLGKKNKRGLLDYPIKDRYFGKHEKFPEIISDWCIKSG